MEETLSDLAIVETREELMISPAGERMPSFRTAHFLKPSLGSTDGVSKPSPPSLPPVPPTFEPKKWPLSVNFLGWRNPQKEWNAWVEKMASLHGSTWREAGIYEAILNSTYNIDRSFELVLGVAERWCPETKSFVFPWGEATITLEDVVIISGYSVLGCPVFSPLETEESMATVEKLVQSRSELVRTDAKKASQIPWLKKFKDSGSEIEHEAVLSLWLSRFVLVTSRNTISQNSFPVAILLARGTRVALAPAVLARIYMDLSLLKERIVSLSALELDETSDGNQDNGVLAVTLWSPFQLVQVWVWERFPDLQPKANLIISGEPRLAQWDNIRFKVGNKNVRLIIDSAEESFIWRPYAKALTNWSFPKYYPDREMWLLLGSGSDEEFLSYVRFLRVSELVALDCIEQYLPHRVAMQFGIDQDIPGCVPRCNESPEIAWSCYDYSFGELLCYIPSRLSHADVATQYSKWWKSSAMFLQSRKNKILLQQKASASYRMPVKNLKDQQKSVKKSTKLVGNFKVTHKSAKERMAANVVKKLKLQTFNFKGGKKGEPSSSFKIAPKKLNGAKDGKTSVWSFKTAPKSWKASTNGLMAKKVAKKFHVLSSSSKKSSEDMAGSLVAGARNQDARTTPQPKTLKESALESKGKKSLVNDEFTLAKSSPSLKRKEGEKYEPASPSNPSKTPKTVLMGFAGRKRMNEINSSVPPGFSPLSAFPCNQADTRDSREEDQLTFSEVLKSSEKQPKVEPRLDKDVENTLSPYCFQPCVADNGAGEVEETSVENMKNESVETRQGGNGKNFGETDLYVVKEEDIGKRGDDEPHLTRIAQGDRDELPVNYKDDIVGDDIIIIDDDVPIVADNTLPVTGANMQKSLTPKEGENNVNADADGVCELPINDVTNANSTSNNTSFDKEKNLFQGSSISSCKDPSDVSFNGTHNPPLDRSTSHPVSGSTTTSGSLKEEATKTYIAQFEGPSYTDFHGFRVLHNHISCLEWIYSKEGVFWGNIDILGECTISHLLNVIGDVYATGVSRPQTSLEEKDVAFIARHIEICMGLGFKLDCLKPLLENAKSSLRERRLRSTLKQEMKTLEDGLQEVKTIEARLVAMKLRLSTLNENAEPAGSSKGATLFESQFSRCML